MLGAEGQGIRQSCFLFLWCVVLFCFWVRLVDGESFVLDGDVHGSQEHGEAQDCLKVFFFGRSDHDHSTRRTIVLLINLHLGI
jgi:hypothetical protein